MQRLLGVLFGTVLGLAVIAGMAKLNLMLFTWPDFDWRSPRATRSRSRRCSKATRDERWG